MIILFFCLLAGGGGGEEGDETLPDGGQSGSAGVPSSAGQAANLRRRLARGQNRHRLVNKPQDFQVSLIVFLLKSNTIIFFSASCILVSFRWPQQLFCRLCIYKFI